jgi:spore coat protein U-like protein
MRLWINCLPWGRLIKSILVLAPVLGAVPAAAATAGSSFSVTATVLASCIVASTGTLGFGNYTASSSTPDDAQTSVNVTCSSGLTYTIALDGGQSANVAARAMVDSGAHSLTYALYTTNGYSTIWGDGTGSTSTRGGTGSGSAQNFQIYGRVPVGQYVAAGTGYADVVNVTVTY